MYRKLYCKDRIYLLKILSKPLYLQILKNIVYMKKKVLLINAHQYYDRAKGLLNQSLVEIAQQFFEQKDCEVMTTDIDKGYDLEEEVQKHLQADLIVIQTPVYWFNSPWIHKKYIDEVFNFGGGRLFIDDGRTRKDTNKQYGTGGKLQGKKLMISSTWNAPKETFGNTANYMFKGKLVADVLYNLTLPYKFCGIEAILPDFNCYDVLKNTQIAQYEKDYLQHLELFIYPKL